MGKRKQAEYNGAGIYGLYNAVANTIYIGKSSHVANRFQTHRDNFKVKSKDHPMYQEPIEHFSFLVLHKLSKKDYSRFGSMLENLYVYQSQEMHMSVYNRNLLNGGLYSVLWTFKIGDRISKAITEEYGKRADYIRLMNEKNRKKLCDEVNARKKQAC